jgi:NAD(P)-dependent dehydrogenase (short-subunit alcohol dehydrogenase family)
VPTHFAAQWWREQHRAGTVVDRSVINTSSTSGLLGNPGQTNYGAAKAGIGAFTMIAAQELRTYGGQGQRHRARRPAPASRRRRPGLGDLVQPPPEPNAFDLWDPANVSPSVAYLASERSTETGSTYFVQGGTVRRMEPWRLGAAIEREDRWTIAELAAAMPELEPDDDDEDLAHRA